MNTRYFVIFIFVVFVLFTCNTTNFFKTKTVRERYRATLPKKEVGFIEWDSAYYRAKEQSLLLELPEHISFKNATDSLAAVSYHFPIKRGEKIVVDLPQKIDTIPIFIEIREKRTGSLVAELPQSIHRIDWEAKQEDTLQILIQGGFKTKADHVIKLYKQPAYEFPVMGKNNPAMGSFWGAQRDGGKRNHEGIDIFAKKGTPVLAVTNGKIRRTGNRGLGGKQVWLYDREQKLSVYYAHLDSIIAVSGSSVKRGDTLGTVGNTGNASRTSPHLHFGLYGFGGAIDPLFFIKKQSIPKGIPSPFAASVFLAKATPLRSTTHPEAPPIKVLEKKSQVMVLARLNHGYHVIDQTGTMGFISLNAVE